MDGERSAAALFGEKRNRRDGKRLADEFGEDRFERHSHGPLHFFRHRPRKCQMELELLEDVWVAPCGKVLALTLRKPLRIAAGEIGFRKRRPEWLETANRLLRKALQGGQGSAETSAKKGPI